MYLIDRRLIGMLITIGHILFKNYILLIGLILHNICYSYVVYSQLITDMIRPWCNLFSYMTRQL
jgi:hypothetical protein